MFDFKSLSVRVYALVTALLVVAPLLTHVLDQSFYLDLLTRALILTIAAASLNLIIGYGGMISLGHAAFIGIGAYSVGIPAYYEIYNGFVHLGIAIAASALFALLTGMICLRTRGLYFIMITLAFAQMIYFTFVSLDEYGADDGLVIYQRSEFPGFMDIENPATLYYVVLVVLLGLLFVMNRIVNARFGRVIIGAKHNEQRMQALGYDVYKYKLICYVIAGTMAGVAGFFLGNFTNYISPEMMDWTHSGELIFMIIIGGTGAVFSPVVGTVLFLLMEELLSGITVYWHLIFGLLLIALVLFGKGGLHGLLERLQDKRRS
ncbi:MAG: branched-chain amino acid transport system permease protein [Saprospiraceae bacterium]